jgi:WD40 repeat protein
MTTGLTLLMANGTSGGPPVPDRAPAARDDNKRPRPDRYGDPLPEGALLRLGTVRLRSRSLYGELAFSPDGKTLATLDGTLWEVATGKCLAGFKKPRENISSLSYSRRGTLRAVGLDAHQQTVWLWNLATGKKSRLLRLPENAPHQTPMLLPDGKTLAMLRSTAVPSKTPPQLVLWDVATGKPRRRLRMPDGQVDPVAFSVDGKTLATGHTPWDHSTTDIIRLWDLATGKELCRIGGHRAQLVSLAFTPDGKSLVSGTLDGAVRLWDVASGKELRRFDQALGHVEGLAVSPDGKLLAATASSGGIWLFDLATGREVSPWSAHRDWVLSVAFSPDGRLLASGGADHTVWLWQAATGKPLRQLRGHDSPIRAVAFAPDGKSLASLDDGREPGYVLRDYTIRLWDPANGRLRRRWHGSTADPAPSLAFAPDGTMLASGTTGHDQETKNVVVLWNPATGKERRTLPGGKSGITAVAFAPGGKLLASGGEDLRVLLWDPGTGKLLRPMERPATPPAPPGDEPFPGPGGASALAFTPDGRTLVGMEENSILYFWEAASGQIRRRKPLHEGPRHDFNARQDMALSPDGRLLATADRQHRVCVWDPESLRLLHRFAGHRNTVYSLAFSPDGRKLASASSDTTVLVWDVSGLAPGRPSPAAALPAAALPGLWRDLAGHALPAYYAILRLADDPARSVPFLAKRLRPVPRGDAQRIARLIRELDDSAYRVREEATTELRRLADVPEPALRRALAGKPSLEVRSRVEALLKNLPGPEWLRQERSLEALERAGTPEARRLLEELGEGAPEARLTQEARASAQRLAKREAARH